MRDDAVLGRALPLDRGLGPVKRYYLRKQELVFCVRDTASGVFLHPIAAHLSKCLPFFWMVILMTFVAMLGIYGIASRNFMLVSLWLKHSKTV